MTTLNELTKRELPAQVMDYKKKIIDLERQLV